MMSGASSFSEVLAKPDKTLEKHTKDAIEFLSRYLNWHGAVINKVAKQLGIKREELYYRLFVSVYLHDIGKANSLFQQRMQKKPKESKLMPGELPHPLLAVPFAMAAVPPLDGIHYEALAIMSSHSHFYDLLYEKYDDHDFKMSYGSYLEHAKRFYHDLPLRAREAKILPKFDLEEPKYWVGKELRKKLILENASLQDSNDIARNAFSLFASALHHADWLASGSLWEYNYSPEGVKSKLMSRLKKFSGFQGLYPFQKQAAETDGSLFIKAPTGKGKTEAALLWADRNRGKIIYLLPTRVTSNALYERCKQYFGEASVGLSHGTAALTIAEEKGLRTGKFDEKAYREKKLLSSTFMTPITVATVDQLLLSEFNWGWWELLKQNASGATVIFDEVHSYDFYTTSLILEILQELGDYSTKFALMSATFPTYLKKILQRILPRASLLEERGFDGLRRHKIYLQECLLEDKLQDIVKDYKDGKSVLVIVDTVKCSKEIHRKLEESLRLGLGSKTEKPILLYHSLFVEKDRRRKEKEIQNGAKKKGFIAVTTQVVEVSLDIDYDVLYTEIAPIDALIQRMGRVNRKGQKGIADVWICKATAGAEHVYGQENLKNAWRILERISEKEVTEGELKELVDDQYPPSLTLRGLEEERKGVLRRLSELKYSLWYVQTLGFGPDAEKALRSLARTREEKVANVEVIPRCFQEKVQETVSRDRYVAVLDYMLRAPLYLIRDSIEVQNSIRYVDLDYNYDNGLTIGDEVQARII